MNHEQEPATPGDPPLDAHADLEAVLAAWHGATVRLEKTHETLTSEVARLTNELEVKNRELARKNRLADLGQMASHVAHEVRNNLVPVALYLSLLERRLSDDSGSLDVLEKVQAGFTALDSTVNDLLHFTSDHDPVIESFGLAAMVVEIAASLDPQFQAQAVAVEIDVPETLELQADAGMVRRALLNLMLNALDAMPDGGELVVTSYEGPTEVEIEVADSGVGLNSDTQARLFEPFFTTKNTGTGLGLAIVERVASSHGGTVSACNCPEGGAALTISIPQRRALRVAA